ncbi:UNVERIFIED_CONTAM: hypothetical protein Sangu_1306900 [Sesamum angustifolium]|uniref:Replication factor A C-terminal domain-containing protein n=1 Tax=Sesamum angustifolium TaxID=2727405 RepID=A0AAW2NL44_9LAMI
MILTLWNEVISTEGASILATADKMPIIAATRLHVTDYNGISLSARGFANIILNPSYSETQSLRTWRTKNHVFLTELVRDKVPQAIIPRQNIPRDSFSSIANVITNNVEDKLWVKVAATIIDVDQKYWYMACDNCLKGTTGEYGWEITCNFCRAETIAKPRRYPAPKDDVKECSSSHSHGVDLSTIGVDPNVATASMNTHILQSTKDSQDAASSSASLPKDK